MVSFQAPLSPSKRVTVPEFEDPSRKRKWHDPQRQETLEKRLKTENFDVELHLEKPLPLEWQRCLDIKSGQIHFYNTRTHKRTSRDPRRSPELEPPISGHMSLDLELNLPCDSQRKSNTDDQSLENSCGSPRPGSGDLFMDSSMNKKNSEMGRYPSWLAFDGDLQEQEMVATVCMRCHMLVMLCKSSPACPNCKFMHSPDQSAPKLFKPKLSLLC